MNTVFLLIAPESYPLMFTSDVTVSDAIVFAKLHPALQNPIAQLGMHVLNGLIWSGEFFQACNMDIVIGGCPCLVCVPNVFCISFNDQRPVYPLVIMFR